MPKKPGNEGDLAVQIQHRLIEEIAERKQVEDALFRKQTQLQSLLKVSQEINTSLDQTTIRKILVEAASSLMNAASGAAGLMQDGRMIFREYHRGNQCFPIDYTFDYGFGVPGHVMQTKKTYMTNDAEHDAHVVPEIRAALGFRQLIDVPILSRSGKLLGCFEIHDPKDARLFDDADIKLLEGLAASAAVALDNAKLISERERMESMLKVIIETTAEAKGQHFFGNIVKCLCDLLAADCVIAGEITHEGHVKTLAMQLDGNSIEEYAYDLPGTPCENVAAKGYCEYPENIRDLFPDDKALADMQAEGYAGMPIRDKQGNAIGIFCALFRRKSDLPENAREVFGIIAARAGAEIACMHAEAALGRHLAEVEESRQSMLYTLEDMNETSARVEQAKQEWMDTFDTLTDPIFLHDAAGLITRANLAYAEKAGMSVEAVIAKPYWQVFPKLDKQLHSCAEAEAVGEANEEFSVDDGTVFLAHSYVMGGDAGRERVFIHWLQDISERKLNEEALRESEKRLSTIIETNPYGIMVVNKAGIITFVNPAAEALYDRKGAELIGQSFGWPLIREGTGEIDLARQDGSVRQVEMQAVPIKRGTEQESIVLFRDITAQRQAEAGLKRSLEGTIQVISRAVEARDPYTAGHEQRVAELAVTIAREMGLDEDQVEGVRLGATIHDIGKIQIPAEILSKPSRLTDMEYALVKVHPQTGYDILKDIEFTWPVADIAHQHHEQLDGSGYPQGLKGDEICPEARIVAVADIVEAMASHRPYRPGLGIDVALKEIKSQRGKALDGDAVDACLKLFSENRFNFTDWF